MKPGSPIAQLVQAILFELIDANGNVVGSWGEQIDPEGPETYTGMGFPFPDDPPLIDNDRAFLGVRNTPDRRMFRMNGGHGPNATGRAYTLLDATATTIVGQLLAGTGGGNEFAGVTASRVGTVAPFIKTLILQGGGIRILVTDDGAGSEQVQINQIGDYTAPVSMVQNIVWTPTVSNQTLGTGGAIAARARRFGIPEAGQPSFVVWSLKTLYGTGGGPTGDIGFSLPSGPGAGWRAYGRGHAAPSAGRWDLDAGTIVNGSASMLVRPAVYNGAAAGNAAVSVSSLTMSSWGQTWGAGTEWFVAGTYIEA